MLKYMPIEVIITSTTAVNTPNSLEIIENTGHVVNEENPKALAEVLDQDYDEILSS